MEDQVLHAQKCQWYSM